MNNIKQYSTLKKRENIFWGKNNSVGHTQSMQSMSKLFVDDQCLFSVWAYLCVCSFGLTLLTQST